MKNVLKWTLLCWSNTKGLYFKTLSCENSLFVQTALLDRSVCTQSYVIHCWMIYRLFVSEIPAEQVVFYQHVSYAILHRLGNLWKSENNGKLVACEQAHGFVLGFALAFARGVYELTPKWFRRSLGARTCLQTTPLLGLSQSAMQTCKLLLILVYLETWLRLSLSKSKCWPRWLISLFYSRKPKELKDILSPKLLIFVSEKSFTRKLVTVAQSDLLPRKRRY